MRCPDCQKRNSVAAWKCKFCGAKFKRKTMSPGKKVFLLTAFAVLGGSIYLAFALPKLVDPAEQLMSIAKHVSSGPTSPEDAKKSKAEFDEAVKKLLMRFGSSNSGTLAERLKACLPTNGTFEVLVVDLPKGLKLVEIDTVLQASDFLVMKGTNDTRVIPLPGFEVYDDARAVNDQAGTVIVLLGHSGGQLPHRPIVRTYALLPDSVSDDTATMIPAISGEGSAKFEKDNSDINLELALPSILQAEKITTNMPMLQDKVLRMKLSWKESKYVPTLDFPQDLNSTMLLLSRCLKYPEYTGSVTAALGAEAGRLMKDHASPEVQDLIVSKLSDKKPNSFTISAAKKKFDIEMKKAGNSWQIASYSVGVLSAPVNVTTAKTTPVVSTATDTSVSSVPVNTTTVVVEDKNQSATKSSATVTGTSTGTGTDLTNKSGRDILAALKPEKAGSNVKSNDNTSTITSLGQSKNDKSIPGSKGSTWVDDEPGGHNKTPVAVLPPGLKNADKARAEKERAEKERAEKEKREKEKKDKEKAEREKAEREKAERERAERDKQAASAGSGTSARIADYLGTDTVRLRSGPGLNMKAIDEIPRGTKIQILGTKKGWYKVSYGGKIGYVFAPLVDTSGKAPSSNTASQASTAATPAVTTPPPAQETHENNSESANESSTSGSGATIVRPMTVRDANRKAISSVQPGQHVVVLSGLVNNRYKIRMPDGTVGYVHKDAIKHEKVETPPEFVP